MKTKSPVLNIPVCWTNVGRRNLPIKVVALAQRPRASIVRLRPSTLEPRPKLTLAA